MDYTYTSPLERDDHYNNYSGDRQQTGPNRISRPPHRRSPYSVPSSAGYLPPPPAATYLQSSQKASSSSSYRTKVYTPSSQSFERRSPYGSQPAESEPKVFRPKYSDRFKSQKYPKELTDLFGALECKLCCVEVPSPISAKMHYSGKQHSKKIKQYLEEWSARTGQPMPEIEESTTSPAMNALSNYCEVCDVRMASTSDKMLHYSGRQHQKNERDPQNARKKKKECMTIDLERFGIGHQFDKRKVEERVKLEEDLE